MLWPWSRLAALGALMLSHALVLYPTLRPASQWLGPVITRFTTTRKEVWLTIDDGPESDTPQLLDLFDSRGVKATFFVKGSLASRYPDIIHDIAARGHSIGNHSQNHPSGTFWCLTPSRIASEIDQCNRTLTELTGFSPTWFRAPVGMKNPAVHPLLDERGMRLIGWSSRGFDAVLRNPERIARSVLRDLEPGAIILLHQGQPHSIEILDRVITASQEQGYSFVIPSDEQLR
ncbi:MAG TPA: polysaccharide deacetylase family protein [Thermoanaerobaculia bacterium]